MMASGRTLVASSGRISGVGICQGQNDRTVRHGSYHFLAEQSCNRYAKKNVSPLYGIFKLSHVGFPGECSLVRLHIFIPVRIDHTPAVSHHYFFSVHSQLDEQIQTGYPGGPRTGCRETDFSNILANDGQCIEHSRRRYDGRAMLVVVKYGNVKALLERGFDDECSRGLDILEIDATESGFQ